MMSTLPYSPTEVAALREDAKLYAIELSISGAAKLLKIVGDRALCIDALLMPRRPEWLVAIVGER